LLLFIKADRANVRAAYAALAEFGAAHENILVDDLADRSGFIRFGREPHGIEILPGIPGVDFDAAWERRVEGVMDTKTGLTALFISRDNLIASKPATGRTRDRADVEGIREAGQSVEPASSPNKPSDSGPAG
jgi:hypothetical protein